MKGWEQRVVFENTREVMYKEEKRKLRFNIELRKKIILQRFHRFGKPNSFKPRSITARFLRYSNRELVMVNARKRLKGHQDFMSSSTYRRNYMRYDNCKWKNSWLIKEAREKGHKAHASKLFDNGKYVAPDQTLQLLWLDLSPFTYFLLLSCFQLNIWHS